jgi:hypothetical protein
MQGVRGSNPRTSTNLRLISCESPGHMSHFGSGTYVSRLDPASGRVSQWLRDLCPTNSTFPIDLSPNSQVRVRHLPDKFHFSGRDK